MTEPLRRIRATTAEEYWVPSVRLADAHARNGGPTWMYRFDFSPATGRYAGESAHTSELDLVWDRFWPAQPAPAETDIGHRAAGSAPEHSRDPQAQPGTPADPAALALSGQMHAAWCAFIRGEAPGTPGLPVWPAYNADTRPTLLLDRSSRVEDRPAEAELRLWDGVL